MKFGIVFQRVACCTLIYCFVTDVVAFLLLLFVVAVGGGLCRCTSGGGPVLLLVVLHNVIWTSSM